MAIKAKDEKIMAALLEFGSVSAAEKASGVSRATIYKRLADEEFKTEYERRREKILNEACSSLQSTLTTAVDTIRQIINNAENAPQIRLNACALILQNCLKYVEQAEIISELKRLEKIVSEYN